MPISIKFISIFFLFCCSNSLAIADGHKKAELKSQKLSDNIHLITGKGGNIAVSIGEDGTFLIDDKFAPMTDAILNIIKKAGGDTPKFVINTHWHGDHTGGNENLGKKGSIIVAHANVRQRLSEENFISAFNMKAPPQPKAALPVITFTQELRFHLNNDTIDLQHIANAHTDGDSIIFFQKDNILHTGDLFFNGFYPFIDVEHGGSLKGMLTASEILLKLANDDTKIIPGHGPMATKKDLSDFRDMLDVAYKRLSALKKDGKSLEQALTMNPLKTLDAEWSDGLFKTNKWITLIYNGLD
ncbi:MAG: MBL fold metallo-hydrolase [Cellvibrionaceae bacterium]